MCERGLNAMLRSARHGQMRMVEEDSVAWVVEPAPGNPQVAVLTHRFRNHSGGWSSKVVGAFKDGEPADIPLVEFAFASDFAECCHQSPWPDSVVFHGNIWQRIILILPGTPPRSVRLYPEREGLPPDATEEVKRLYSYMCSVLNAAAANDQGGESAYT